MFSVPVLREVFASLPRKQAEEGATSGSILVYRSKTTKDVPKKTSDGGSISPGLLIRMDRQ